MARKRRSQPKSEDSLSQQEADNLLAMAKESEEIKTYRLPTGGEQIAIPLVSSDKEHKFLLDINSSRILLSKYTFQTRVYRTIPLIRLDIDGRPHTNPDGTDFGGTHIHRYRAGHALDWAENLPETFDKDGDALKLLDQFMDECKIIKKPLVEPTVEKAKTKTLFDNVND